MLKPSIMKILFFFRVEVEGDESDHNTRTNRGTNLKNSSNDSAETNNDSAETKYYKNLVLFPVMTMLKPIMTVLKPSIMKILFSSGNDSAETKYYENLVLSLPDLLFFRRQISEAQQRSQAPMVCPKISFLPAVRLINFTCGGSLIGPRHVLTAAHCVDKSRRKNYEALFVATHGIRNSSPGQRNIGHENWSNCSDLEVREHPQYENRPEAKYNDLAIMVLDHIPQRPHHVKPLYLPPPSARSDTFEGQNATLAGWSETYHASRLICSLTDAQLTHIKRPMNSSLICAGDEIGRKNLHEGASGGPLVVKYAGRWIQIGVASHGIFDEGPYYPAVYMRVTKYLDWIQDNIVE
ncbi:hypothetical protein L9F63_011914 [Diploptera punctata]|uniref:Peptidase S1 domain-containing protein n=1 Tax=Diploptera punctata TaxID=6984 RepID=A0AAD8AEG0_DIPPU|nr:hypothetical protein L9F63_011914 [Diploptera punctata]